MSFTLGGLGRENLENFNILAAHRRPRLSVALLTYLTGQ